MREVTVRKEELLAKVLENRESHIKEYIEACEGYRQKALTKIDEVFAGLKSKIESLKEGQTIGLMAVSFGLEVPETYEKEYDQVIMLLKMTTNEKIKLSSDEFACYVMDDWSWKETFTASNARYK